MNILQHEWKTRLSSPAILIALVLFAVILAYAGINGRAYRDARLAAIDAHRAEVAAELSRWREDLGASSKVPPWRGSAMDVVGSTYLPPRPLEYFAIGQSDLLPSFAAISLWKPDLYLFSRYELADPVSLRLGGIDLTKTIILLLPLLMIVLCFDVVSAERDSNLLCLLYAQGARLRRIFWSRLLIRAAVVFVPGIAIPAAFSPDFAVWTIGVVFYALFWLGMVAWIASSTRRSGQANILRLLFAWAMFTLIIPATAAAIADVAHPAPSRLAMLAEARELEIRTERAEAEVTQRFLLDHPEMQLDQKSEVPAYFRTAYFVTSEVDRATQPVLAAFEEAAARRDEALAFLRYLSPAIIVHAFSNELAGTSAARYRRYAREARILKAAYVRWAGPYIVAGRRPTLAEAEALPQFQFEDEALETVLGRNTFALLFLAVVAGALLFLADRRVNRGGSEVSPW